MTALKHHRGALTSDAKGHVPLPTPPQIFFGLPNYDKVTHAHTHTHTHTHTHAQIHTYIYSVKHIEMSGPASVAQLDASSDWRPEVAGSTPAEVGNILSWRLIMKYFLRSFSPFRCFKKGSFQFLAKECA